MEQKGPYCNRKLTIAQEALILEDWASGLLTVEKIAKFRGVNKWTVRRLIHKNRRVWRARMRLRPIEVETLMSRLVHHALESNITVAELNRAIHKRYLIAVLDMHRGNQVHSAKFLGVHRNTLSRQLRICGVDVNGHKNGRGRPVEAKETAACA